MNTKPILLTGLALIGLLGTSWAQSGRPTTRQDDKNAMRNLGSGLGAAALNSARNGRIGDAIVLGAGAALAGKKYEDARKAQSDESRYGRDDRSDRYGRNDRYDSNDRYSSNDRYNTDAYDRDRYSSPSRWERERIERERCERIERERRERIERERCERIERERREREREEREARIRWEREHRGHNGDRDRGRDCRDRDHRHG